VTSPSSSLPEGCFPATFLLRSEPALAQGYADHVGYVEIGPEEIRIQGVWCDDRVQLLSLSVGLAGLAVYAALTGNAESNTRRYTVDLSQTEAVYDEPMRRVALRLSNGLWLTLSMDREVLGVEREGDYQVVLEKLRCLLGLRIAAGEAYQVRGPSVFFLVLGAVLLAAMAVLVLILALR